MKKAHYLRSLAVLIILSSILSLTTCDVFLPQELDFVTIYKAEWDLIEDTSVHTYVANDSLTLGADKNGTENQQALWNTQQIQKAIDHFTAQGYKNIRLEKGEYYVGGRKEKITWASGTQNWINPEMIRIQPKHSGLRFDLGGATLKLEPHDRVESRVIWLYSDRTGATTDIKIFNGNIIGDRINHRFADPYPQDRKYAGPNSNSHEWGSGIDIWGDVRNVELYNLNISEVTGDCIGANGFNITIRDCNISRGRRNGIVSVYVDGLTIYNNKIHCIYNGGIPYERCRYCHEIGKTGNHPDSQHEYHGKGIGAEACIAFEHTVNNYFDKQINIKIFNNWLDGQKPAQRTDSSSHAEASLRNRTYYMDNAINFHWATYATWIYNNDIIGDFEWSCGGSNTLIENNRFDSGRKGHRISKGLVASGSISENGRSAANYVVIRNNHFKNYNIVVGGASGGVSDSQPHWRHDYAIVDNVLVYDEPRVDNNNYWTALCASVNNSVVLGNVFDVRTNKPIVCAIYIDVVDSSWEKRIPANLKVDMYISGNTYNGSIWREKHYCYNNSQDIGNAPQYEKFEHSKMPGNYSETNNYQATYDMYREILKKTTSVGNIWGRVR